MCPFSLCVRFMPGSAVDPVELFSSVIFRKDLVVECFHVQKIMFGFFVVVRSRNKEKKSLILKKKFFLRSEMLTEHPDSFFLPSIDFPLEAYVGGEGRF